MKQVHVGNDTTTLSHHPYILCRFATTYTSMLHEHLMLVVYVYR